MVSVFRHRSCLVRKVNGWAEVDAELRQHGE